MIDPYNITDGLSPVIIYWRLSECTNRGMSALIHYI